MVASAVTQRASSQPGLDWTSPVKVGLLSGIVGVYLGLVGIIEALANRQVIIGTLSTGDVILLSVFVFAGYTAASRAARGYDKAPIAWCLISGAIAGFLTSVVLSLVVIIGQAVNMRTMFINTSPTLYDTHILG
ncbi:MAG: hypothetical protein ABIN58_07450, partial [candidate division WOR-3 bacterium]